MPRTCRPWPMVSSWAARSSNASPRTSSSPAWSRRSRVSSVPSRRPWLPARHQCDNLVASLLPATQSCGYFHRGGGGRLRRDGGERLAFWLRRHERDHFVGQFGGDILQVGSVKHIAAGFFM